MGGPFVPILPDDVRRPPTVSEEWRAVATFSGHPIPSGAPRPGPSVPSAAPPRRSSSRGRTRQACRSRGRRAGRATREHDSNASWIFLVAGASVDQGQAFIPVATAHGGPHVRGDAVV